MRLLLFIISVFCYSNLFGQTPGNYAVFKIEGFSCTKSGKAIRTERVKLDGPLDLEFYRKYFNTPYYFPEKLIDKSFRNQMIAVWMDTTKEKDFKFNWAHTFKYDEKSRVTSYSFSGCLICSNLPYTVKVFYNGLDEVVRMEKYDSSVVLASDYVDGGMLIKKQLPVEVFILEYDKSSNIIQIERFKSGVLSERIRKM